MQAVADGVLARPEALGGGIVDERDLRMGGIVSGREEAAAAERDIQGAEIVRGDGVQVWVRLSAGGESTAIDRSCRIRAGRW
jgi:hypothetical protein